MVGKRNRVKTIARGSNLIEARIDADKAKGKPLKVPEWEYVGFCYDGELIVLDGINVWAHHWIATGDKTSVKDPKYGQVFEFEIWKIETGKKAIEFVAGEFSNCVWGFYIKKK